MSISILTTKLYIPARQPNAVPRSRLIEKLNEGLYRKLTLISAPAGFGKTTLITSWLAMHEYPVAWLSLDRSDGDLSRFLTYLVSALQTVNNTIGKGVLTALQSPQLPPIETLITPLLNEITTLLDEFALILDDYHAIDSAEIDHILHFLLDHLPAHMHIIITTREDPQLPLARLRARGQLTEIRATDLRFTVSETSDFLKHTMGLDLSPDDINALENRTEGWIVGLQLAAISMQNLADKTAFIEAFTGSHQYVLDYLLEEVLHQQPDSVQHFLTNTSILDKLCIDLCNVVVGINESEDIIVHLIRNNLFIIPLDHERKWFRYHHLFGDLLRQRLQKQTTTEEQQQLNLRASIWYEQSGYEVDAFQHAVQAHDINRAIALIISDTVPLYFRGAAQPVLRWLETLSAEIFAEHPALYVMYGWVLMATYQNAQVEQKLQLAESILKANSDDQITRNLSGQIAAIRAMLSANHYQTDNIITYSQQALELLNPDDLYIRAVVMRTRAIAYQFKGDRTSAKEVYLQAINLSEETENLYINILSTTGLGIIQLSENQLHQAQNTFQRVLDLVGEPAQPIACAAYLYLAQIYYWWNELDTAQQFGQKSLELAKQIDTVDISITCGLFLARLKLTNGDNSGAEMLLSKLEKDIHQRQFTRQIPALMQLRIQNCLQQENITEALDIASEHKLAKSLVRVHLAQDKPAEAQAIIDTYHQQVDSNNHPDEQLELLILQILIHQTRGQIESALSLLRDVLKLTQTDNFIRLYVDEGAPMQQLLSALYNSNFTSDYIKHILDAFPNVHTSPSSANQALIEPLSERELEILQLIADGLSNQEICERLYLALSTVKGHNRNIYSKLGVSRRTEAVALAREMGLIQG